MLFLPILVRQIDPRDFEAYQFVIAIQKELTFHTNVQNTSLFQLDATNKGYILTIGQKYLWLQWVLYNEHFHFKLKNQIKSYISEYELLELENNFNSLRLTKYNSFTYLFELLIFWLKIWG